MVGKTPHSPPGPGKSKNLVEHIPPETPVPVPRSVAAHFENGATPPPSVPLPVDEPRGPAMGVEEAAGIAIVPPGEEQAAKPKGYKLPAPEVEAVKPEPAPTLAPTPAPAPKAETPAPAPTPAAAPVPKARAKA